MSDLDILVILRHYGADVPNVQHGGRWKAVQCVNPEHDDSRASAGTNGYGYRCLACGLSGGALSIIMQIEGVNLDRAIRTYEEVSGDSIREVRGKPTRKRSRIVPRKPGDSPRDGSPTPVGNRPRPRGRA